LEYKVIIWYKPKNKDMELFETLSQAIKPQRTLYTITQEIRKDWRDKNGKPAMYFGAIPYFKAMECLNDINDNYGMDTAKSIVLYFLANAGTWRGPKAKEIKAELKLMCK
jgi:hypothetical protein